MAVRPSTSVLFTGELTHDQDGSCREEKEKGRQQEVTTQLGNQLVFESVGCMWEEQPIGTQER